MDNCCPISWRGGSASREQSRYISEMVFLSVVFDAWPLGNDDIIKRTAATNNDCAGVRILVASYMTLAISKCQYVHVYMLTHSDRAFII